MTPKRFVIAAVTAAAGMFAALVAANVIIDSQGVFGTRLLPASANANPYYRQFKTYRSDPSRYDGLYFASSRGGAVPLDDLADDMGHVEFANFAVPAGTIASYLPILQYVLREGERPDRPLRAVLLLLDIDSFGLTLRSYQPLQLRMPPEITGDSRFDFWWKHLTTIQWKTWRSAISEARAEWNSGKESRPWPARLATADADPLNVPPAAPPAATTAVLRDMPRLSLPFVGQEVREARTTDPESTASREPRERIRARAEYKRHLELLASFARLCRRNGVSLVIATSPLSPNVEQRLDLDDMQEASNELLRATQTPIWDFTRAGSTLDQPGYWTDELHFTHAVGRMIVSRMVRRPLPESWSSFGRLHRLPQMSGAM